MKRVLCADDEVMILELLKDLFEAYGYFVKTAENGKDAIEILRSECFDAIVSDIRMPYASGVDVLEFAAKLTPKPKIYLMTGFADITDKDVIAKGGDGLLLKPLDITRILDVVNASLA